MRAGRLFVLLAVAAVGAISIWQVSDDEGRRMLVAASHNSPQQQNRERHDQQAALCRKYSKATPLTVKLEGRTLAVQGQGRASQIASQIRQALPGARVFVDGKLEERAGYDVPQYVREAPPDDAVVLRVSERQLPEDEPKNAFTTIHEITVLDSAGAVNGRWQGFLNGCPSSSPQDPLSLVAFLASQPAGMSAPCRNILSGRKCSSTYSRPKAGAWRGRRISSFPFPHHAAGPRSSSRQTRGTPPCR